MCTLQALQLLLDAGGTPECRDKVSMEGPFDVAQNDEIRTILVRRIFLFLFLFLLCRRPFIHRLHESFKRF
jgi:hypothetical protein